MLNFKSISSKFLFGAALYLVVVFAGVPIMGILAIVFGAISCRGSNKGMAIAGIVTGSFGVLIQIIAFAVQ